MYPRRISAVGKTFAIIVAAVFIATIGVGAGVYLSQTAVPTTIVTIAATTTQTKPAMKNPDTIIETTFGESEILNPAWAHDKVSDEVIFDKNEKPVFFNREKADNFASLIVGKALSIENGLVNDEGEMKIFPTRSGMRTLGELEEDMFKFVFVSLRVLDPNGNPINRAQVKCYSEDWFIRYPDTMRGEYGFALTDEYGWVNFKIPVGNWTFFASAGEVYESSMPGLGYFVVLRNVRILEDSSFILKPDDLIDLTIVDVNGNPVDGRISVMASDYVPIMEVPRSGVTRGGHILIHVSRGFSYDILFLKEPSSDKVGYIIHEKIGQARLVRIHPSAESLSQLTFRIYDKQYERAAGFLDLFYHNFSINGWAVNWEISDLDRVLLTPGKIWASLKLVKDGWHFSFYGSEYLLSPGLTKTISIGGPFTPRLWVSVYDWDFKETGPPQIWLQISDGFGNLLDNFWDPNGQEDIPLDLLQNGAVIFSENLGNRRVHSETCATPWMQIRINNVYSKENSPEYKLRVDMGPFGIFELTGVLLSDETLLPYKSMETEHFILRYPAIFDEKFSKAALWLESAYRVLSTLLNESVKEKTTVDFHICWGFFANPNRIWFNFGDVVWDNYSPNDVAAGSQVARAGGLLHELAHVFQLSDSNIKEGRNYYEPWWFGEPFASMLAGEVIWSLLGEKAGMMAFGERNRISFDFLVRPEWAADFQHVPYTYLRKHYGTEIHRGMIRLWAGVDENCIKDRLLREGFSINETHVALYSYLARQNLAWLFQASLPDVSEERIAQALSTLQDSVKPDFELILEDSIKLTIGEPPRNISITLRSFRGFSSIVALSVENIPPGVQATIENSSINLPSNSQANTTLRLYASWNADPGSYSIKIKASGGGLTHEATLRIKIVTVERTVTTTAEKTIVKEATVVVEKTVTRTVTTTTTISYQATYVSTETDQTLIYRIIVILSAMFFTVIVVLLLRRRPAPPAPTPLSTLIEDSYSYRFREGEGKSLRLIVRDRISGKRYKLEIFKENTAKDIINALIKSGLIRPTPRQGYEWQLLDSRFIEIHPDEKVSSRLFPGENEVYLGARTIGDVKTRKI